jgi:hypothetical protein
LNENEQREKLKDKLARALRRLEGLKQKSKLLEMQYEDARNRENNSNELVMELLERQRELNVMLNRANIMLNRTQEAMALTSMEFNEIAKALPEPKKAEWSERVAKVNELFKKTGIQDAEVLGLDSPDAADFSADQLKKESEQAFGRRENKPPHVEAEVVEDHQPGVDAVEQVLEEYDSPAQEEEKKSWWQRAFAKTGTDN